MGVLNLNLSLICWNVKFCICIIFVS